MMGTPFASTSGSGFAPRVPFVAGVVVLPVHPQYVRRKMAAAAAAADSSLLTGRSSVLAS